MTYSNLPDKFLPIPGYSQYYLSPKYEVWSFKPPRSLRKLSGSINNQGYIRVAIRLNGKKRDIKLHTLILLTLKGPKPFPKAMCRHLDGNPLNNHPDNLEWGNQFENMADMRRHGRDKLAKLTPNDVKYIYSFKSKTGKRHPRFKSPLNELAKQFNIGHSQIQRIWKQESWQHLT